jgi:hypothetical protein
MRHTLETYQGLEMKHNRPLIPFSTVQSGFDTKLILTKHVTYQSSYREDLELDELLPANYDDLIRRIRDDDEVWAKIYK